MPKTHRLHCQDPWYSLIKSGKKTVEGRKNLPKYASWRPGDTLVFELHGDEFETCIVAIRHYKSLEDYLKAETVERVLPRISETSDAIKVYLQWSTREEIQQLGFLAIEVQLPESSHGV